MGIFKRQKEHNQQLNFILYKCSKGNRKAQEQLYEMHYSYALNIALRYSNSKEIATEIVNDGFLKTFNYLTSEGNIDNFLPWFRKTFVNQAIDYYRKNKKTNENIVYDESLPEITLNDDVISKLSAEEIIGQLQKLPDIYRMVFSLYELEGFSHKEISGKLGISESLSRKNLSRAKKQLKMLLLKTRDYEGV